MDPTQIQAVHLVLAIGFNGLFATVVTTLGWAAVFFLVMQQVQPGRGWGLAFNFWWRVLTLSFALWALSGLSLWFNPTFDRDSTGVSGAFVILGGVILPGGLVGLLLFGRHLMSSTGLLATACGLALLLTALGLSSSEIVFRTADQAVWARETPVQDYLLFLARSAMTTGILLASISCLRTLCGDRKPEVFLSLGAGLACTFLFSALTMALLYADYGLPREGTAFAFQIKFLIVTLLTAAAVAALIMLCQKPDTDFDTRFSRAVLAGSALFGVPAWLLLTLTDLSLRSELAASWLGQAMDQPLLLLDLQGHTDMPTFVTYAVLYVGLTLTYVTGLSRMAQAQATIEAPRPQR